MGIRRVSAIAAMMLGVAALVLAAFGAEPAGAGITERTSSLRAGSPPSAPSLTVTTASGSATLTWTTPANNGSAITGYKVYRGTTSTSLSLVTSLGVVNTYTNTGLTNGTTYYFAVSAVNANGEGAKCGAVAAVPAAPPAAPTLAVPTSPSSGTVNLSWTAPANNGSAITGYKVYRGTTSTSQTLVATLGVVTTFQNTGLTNGVAYYYKVAAVNAKGEGAASAVQTITPVYPPEAPSLNAPVAGNATASLSWTTPANNGAAITAYKVYRGTIVNSLSLVATLGAVNTYNDSALTNGTTYYYAVSAVNSKGESVKSNTQSALPRTVPGAPTLAAPTTGSGTASLSWTAPASNGGSAITGYKVYRGTTSGSQTLLTTLGVVTTFADSGLTNGSTYYYKVTAINAVGESAGSAVQSALPAGPPDAPALNPVTSGNTAATLTWSTPAANGSAITGYKISRGTAAGTLTVVATVGVVNTYTNTALTNGTTYYYAVSAVNAKGTGSNSSIQSVVPMTVPGVPTLGNPTTTAPGKVDLTWTAPTSNGGSAITGYRIWRGPSATSLSVLTDVAAVTAYQDTTVTDGQTYFYAIAAINAAGVSPQTAAKSIAVVNPPTAPVASGPTVGNTQLGITWATPAANGSPITAYKVYRGTSSGSLSLVTTLGLVNSYTYTGLTNGTTYYLAVTATNAKGESLKSNILSASPALPPSAPTLSTPTGDDGSASLSWTAPAANGSPVTGYKVYRGTSAVSLSLLTTLPASPTSFNDTGLANGTTYYYAVSAVNAAGEGVKSSTKSVMPVGPPSAPALSVTGVGDGSVSLGWTAPFNGGSAISGYKIYRGASPSTLALVNVVGSGTLSYEDTGLSNATTYYYVVKAYNVKGIGAPSNTVSATPVGPPAKPTISTCTPGNGYVQLSWSAPFDNGSPITSYEIYAGTTAGGVTYVGVTSGLNFQVSGLVNGTTYYFKLIATNDEGDSPASDAVSCVPASVPSAPVLQTATPGNGSATLTWATPNGNGSAVTNYKVYRGTSPTALSLVTTTGVVNTFTDTGLTNGTTYYYAVSAVNGIGESAKSNQKTCVPSPPASTTTTTTSTPSSTTSLPPGNVNDPNYWEDLGYGYCYKDESPNTPYTLPSAPYGYHWTLLVLKAGSAASNSDWLTQIQNPMPGVFYHPSGKQISYIIRCKKPNNATTTTSPGSTTTTQATTTTVLGSGCEEYTPTSLAISNPSAEPGESVTITGSGVPNDSLVITIKRPGYPEDTIGFAVVDGFGNFSVVVIIPDSYPPGNYTIRVRSADCECDVTTTTQPEGDDDDGNGDDDDGQYHNDDDDGGDDDDGYYGSGGGHRGRSTAVIGATGGSGGYGDDDDGNGDDDDGHSGGSDPCIGASTINITVLSLDLSGCGTNGDDRVYTPGETITWHLMGSPFATNKPPVTITLVSRTPGGPTYTLYSGTYPPSMDVSITIPATAPIDRYYMNQTGKKSNNKVITKSCPVRVGMDAILVAATSPDSLTASRSAMNIGFIGVGVLLLSTLRVRRRRRPARAGMVRG